MEPSTFIPLYVDSELDVTIMALFTLLFVMTTMQVYSSLTSRVEPSVSFYIINEQSQYQICNLHKENIDILAYLENRIYIILKPKYANSYGIATLPEHQRSPQGCVFSDLSLLIIPSVFSNCSPCSQMYIMHQL